MLGNIFWSIYLALLASVALGDFFKGKYKTVGAKIDFLVCIITWLGLFGYVTNIQIFTPIVWKVIFVGGLLWDVTFAFLFKDYPAEIQDIPLFVRNIIVVIILVIFIGPLYYGLYRYAF